MEYQDQSKDELIIELKNIQQKYEALSALYDSDIAEHKRTEEALHASQYLINSIISGTTDAVYVKDVNGHYTLLNNAVEKTVGKTRDEILGKNDFALFPESEAITIIEGDRKVMAGTSPKTYEEYVTVADGSKAIFLSTKGPLFDINGSTIGIFGIVRNITERKISEEKLRESEEKFRKAFLTNPDSITINSLTYGLYVSVNRGFTQILGYSETEVIDKTSLELNIWENPACRIDFTNRLKSFGVVENLEAKLRTKSGKIIDTLVSSVLIDLEGVTHILSVTKDITERKQIELDLIKAKEKAEESDRLKTAFLQNMSHEIRTPMNSIIGFSDLLKDNFNNKEKLLKFTEIISLRSNDLLEIINDILDIAKIESGQLPINLEECNISELFNELSMFYNEHRIRIDKQNIKFSMQCLCSQTDEIIITDKIKLKQIFNNLIINAFRFTNNGEIIGGCKLDKNNNIVFFVSDTGIGIPSDKHELIFNRFVQLNQVPSKAISGTGLGLSIVKGLVNLLGGEISLESEPGKGSVFYFTIVYKKINPVQLNISKTESIKDTHFSNQTILIVEDDYYNAEYLKEIFSDTQLNVLHAENGIDATKIAIEQNIDLVLMDVRLPDMDGYEATRQIISHKPYLKIIAQTAYASQNEKQIAINAGCIDYISKPSKQSALLNMVSKYLK